MPYDLSHLNALWDTLEKTTVRDEDGDLVTDEPFLHFPTGTPVFHIWSWFESISPAFSVTERLYGTPRTTPVTSDITIKDNPQ